MSESASPNKPSMPSRKQPERVVHALVCMLCALAVFMFVLFLVLKNRSEPVEVEFILTAEGCQVLAQYEVAFDKLDGDHDGKLCIVRAPFATAPRGFSALRIGQPPDTITLTLSNMAIVSKVYR